VNLGAVGAGIRALPGDPKTRPSVDMVEQKVKPEDLTENSGLLGTSSRIADARSRICVLWVKSR
jgi:hypothetical protein